VWKRVAAFVMTVGGSLAMLVGCFPTGEPGSPVAVPGATARGRGGLGERFGDGEETEVDVTNARRSLQPSRRRGPRTYLPDGEIPTSPWACAENEPEIEVTP
jgi:hypothetical protein